MKLFSIIKKNIRILIKSKASLLIIIFGPLLIMFLVGLAFDNANTYRINIGVYTPDHNNLTDSFIRKLESPFRVINFDSESSCVEGIKEGTVNTCLVFPEDFNIEKNKTNEVVFYIDYSKINLVWMVRDVVFARLTERSGEITEDLTNTLLKKIENIEREVEEKQPVLIDLTTLNNNIGEGIKKIQSNLNAIDTNFDINEFRTQELSTQVSLLNSYALKVIHDAKQDLDDLKASINSASMNDSEKESMLMLIDEAENNLEGMRGNISNLYNEQNTGEINLLINNLLSKLADVRNKMSTIKASIDENNEELNALKNKLTEDLIAIIKLHETFNNINQEIKGIKVRNVEKIVKPITISIKPLSYKKTHLNYMFPTLIVIVIMFMSILLSSTMVITEKNSPAHFRNVISPTNQLLFSTATFLTSLIIVLPQLLIMLLISTIFLKMELTVGVWTALFTSLLSITIFTLIGMLIGEISNKEEITTLTALTVSTIMLFFSSTIMPIESMSPLLAKVASFNPFVVSEFLLKRALIFQTSILMLKKHIAVLLIYTVVLVLIIVFKDVLFSRLNKVPKKKNIAKA